MERPLHILSVIDENSPFANIFDGIGNLLNSSNVITVHLLYKAEAAQKLETQLSRNKHMGTYRTVGKVVLHEYQEKIGGNIFDVVADKQDCLYWLMHSAYFTQAQAIFKWLEKEEDPDAVYTLSPPAQKPKLLTRIALRLFNTARVQGMENGFIGFTSVIAPEIFSLKDITARNFSYRIATYASLAGIEVKATDVAIAPHPQKVGFGASLVNALQNTWRWMVKDPIKALKEKDNGSVWDSSHPVWRLVFFCIAIVGLLAFPILSFSYGITWDEKGDAEYAELVLRYYMSFGSDKSCFTEAQHNNLFAYLRYYGPGVNLFCAFLSKYISPFGLYETRHIVVSFIGFTGIIYAGRIGKLLGNWQTGVIVMLLLIVSPNFFGHQFNNLKDAPFAAGYIISIYYLICLLRELPRPSRKTMLFASLAFGFTMGVRIGGLLLPAYTAMCLGLYWLYITFKQGMKTSSALVFPFLRNALLISLGAYIVGILFWPYALLDPINNPFHSLTKFTNFYGIINYELFEGQRLFITDKPWYYIPKFILIQTPLFIWFGLGVFLISLLLKIRNKKLWMWVLLLFVSVFPVVYAVMKQSSLYNGWRHFLFVYPPLVILAALGWQWLANAAKQNVYRLSLLGLLSINILLIAFWMVKYHPNQYVYYNELAGGTKGAYSYYETDYYSNSMKQAADWFIENVGTDKPYVITTNNEPLTAGDYFKKENDNVQVIWTKGDDLHSKQSDYAFITSRTMSHYLIANGIFPPKGTVHTIDVDGVPLLAIVKRENNYQPLADDYFTAKKYDSAFYFCQKAYEYDSNNVEILRLYSQVFINTDSIAPAYTLLKRSLTLYPDDYLGLELMGEVYFRQGNHDSALSYFKQSIKHRLNYSKAYINLGATYFAQQKYTDALESFKKAIEYDDTPNANQYCYLTKCYYSLKQYDRAIKAANDALNINPNHAETYLVLSMIYRDMGDAENANSMYVYYLKLTGKM